MRVRNNDGFCEIDLSDVTLVNQASPTVTFSMTDLDYCIDEGSFTLSGGLPADGEYTGDGVSAGSFDPAVAGSCLLYTSPSPRDATLSRMPSSA